MFISFLHMFRATVCPSSGENTVPMRQLGFVILYEWLSGMQGIPDSHPHRITSTKCRINTAVSPDDGHTVARNMWRKEINILRKTVHQVGFIYNIIYNNAMLSCGLNCRNTCSPNWWVRQLRCCTSLNTGIMTEMWGRIGGWRSREISV
jgi:hypothetical protein